MKPIIEVENISKQYRLGTIGTGTVSHDLNRWWHRVRGKEDPYLKIGQANNRSEKSTSDYVWSLRDINFNVNQGEVLGVIGKNGAGKSTLLKILSKITAPTTGSIKMQGRVASLLEVGTGFHPELTGRENVFLNGAILGMTKKEIKSKFDEIVDFSGVEKYIDTPVKRYSSGMYVRLAFAVAAHLEPEILIVDEVLAVGDAEFQKKCLGKMKDVSMNDGRTILFVSHNMQAISELTDNSLYLENGMVKEYGITKQIVSKYLNINQENNNTFKSKYISIFSVKQIERNISIVIELFQSSEIIKPNIGYIIYDENNIPIMGSNPKIERLNIPNDAKNIEITIEHPKLMNGMYNISIWVGDEYKDYEVLPHCCYFYIENMKDIEHRDTNIYGTIIPESKWKII